MHSIRMPFTPAPRPSSFHRTARPLRTGRPVVCAASGASPFKAAIDTLEDAASRHTLLLKTLADAADVWARSDEARVRLAVTALASGGGGGAAPSRDADAALAAAAAPPESAERRKWEADS